MSKSSEQTPHQRRYTDNKHLSLGNCRLKQWDTISHLLQWLKSKTLTTPNAAKMPNSRNSHLLLLGRQNDTATLEDNLAESYKTKRSLTI